MKLNCTIFGLDDDQDTIDLIKVYFDENGINNYSLYTNASEFLNDFNETVHIAIIDHFLAGQQVGFDIMDKILEINNKSALFIRCKIIVISGLNDESTIIKYLNRGIFKYICKSDHDFYTQLVEYVTVAIHEIDSFYELFERQKQRLREINRLIDSNERYTDNVNI